MTQAPSLSSSGIDSVHKKDSLYNRICLITFHIYIWVDALHININQLYKDAEFALLEASPEIIYNT